MAIALCTRGFFSTTILSACFFEMDRLYKDEYFADIAYAKYFCNNVLREVGMKCWLFIKL